MIEIDRFTLIFYLLSYIECFQIKINAVENYSPTSFFTFKILSCFVVTIPFFKSLRKQENTLKHIFQPISDRYIKVTASGFTQNM